MKIRMRNLKHLIYAILVIAGGLASGSKISADTLDMLTRTEDVYKRVSNQFYQADVGVYLYGRANFCINTDLPSVGNYYFRFDITDPNGRVVFTKDTPRSPVPKYPVYLEQRAYVSPADFYTVHGKYKLTVTFFEEYSSINKVLSLNRTYEFQVNPGLRPGGFNEQVRLLLPRDKSVTTPYPKFIWTPSYSGARYNLYISEDGVNPTSAIYWKKENIKENEYIFNGVPPLLPGKRYYWVVQSVDTQGNPIGPNQGKSEVFSFSTTALGETAKIRLVYPNNLIIDDPMPKFRWTSAFAPSQKIEYTVLISMGALDNVVWTGTVSGNEYQLPPNAPDLVPNRKYLWRVVGINAAKNESKTSAIGTFEFEQVVPQVSRPATEQNGTSLRGNVLNHRKITLSDALVYLKLLEPNAEWLKKNESGTMKDQMLKEYSVSSDSFGRFEIKDLIPGKYRIYAEKNYGEFLNTFDKEVIIDEGITNQVLIILDDNSSKLKVKVLDENGWPISNASVTVRNEKYTWKGETNSEGIMEIQLSEGRFNIEATKMPGYSRETVNDVYVKEEKMQKVVLKQSRSGAVRVILYEAGTNQPLKNMEVEGARLR